MIILVRMIGIALLMVVCVAPLALNVFPDVPGWLRGFVLLNSVAAAGYVGNTIGRIENSIERHRAALVLVAD